MLGKEYKFSYFRSKTNKTNSNGGQFYNLRNYTLQNLIIVEKIFVENIKTCVICRLIRQMADQIQ